eukprot:1146862-Pelagomonas_calceolata.AAC.3
MLGLWPPGTEDMTQEFQHLSKHAAYLQQELCTSTPISGQFPEKPPKNYKSTAWDTWGPQDGGCE